MATGQSPWPRASLRPGLYADYVCDDSATVMRCEAAYAAIVELHEWTLSLPPSKYRTRSLFLVVQNVTVRNVLLPLPPAIKEQCTSYYSTNM